MSRGRILYYERYDGFGVLVYPYEPFNLAVVWSGKNIFVRPIIELSNGECYFLYQGKKLNPYIFELRPEEADPDWVHEWIANILNEKQIKIDLENLAGENLRDFQSMLERKSEKLEAMVISKIELYNFRIYQGLNVIELKPDKSKNIFIVSGKNGFGKTTFLMSLVWCLYGRQMIDVDDIYEKEIKEQGGYGTYVKSSLNRQAHAKGDTAFHVAITITGTVIAELPAKEIVIKRSYSTVKGIDTLQILVDGEEKDLIKEELGDKELTGEEMFIREFIMPIEIAKFFLFDAEKIVNLAENTSLDQRRKLSLAYSEILGIKKYEDIKDEMETLRDRLKQSSANPKDKQLLNTLNADVENFEVEIESASKEITLLKETRAQLAYQAEQLRDKLIRAGNTVTEEGTSSLEKGS